MAVRRQPVLAGVANPTLSADRTVASGSGVKPNSTVTVYKNGTNAGTATANGSGAWSYTLSSALQPGDIVTYDAVLTSPAYMVPGAGTPKLLSIGANRTAYGMGAALTKDRTVTVEKIRIGSGTPASLVWSFYNWSAGNAAGTDHTIVGAIAYKNGSSTGVPVTFGGAASKAMPFGATDVQADPITVAALGGLARGDTVVLKTIRAGVAGTWKVPRVVFLRSGQDGCEYNYNAADVTVPLDTSDPNAQASLTSAAATGDGLRFGAVLLGTFTGSYDRIYALVGDSLFAGLTVDPTGFPVGVVGVPEQVLAFWSSGPLAGVNFGLSGDNAGGAIANTNLRASYYKYCTAALVGYGTNSLPAGDITVPQAAHKTLWAQLRAAGIARIDQQGLYPRTSGSYSGDGTFTDEANQTYMSGWAPGGQADAYNTWFASQVGVAGGVDTFTPITAIRGVDDHKWKVGGTGYTRDGTHPSNGAPIAQEWLSKIDANYVAPVVTGPPALSTFDVDMQFTTQTYKGVSGAADGLAGTLAIDSTGLAINGKSIKIQNTLNTAMQATSGTLVIELINFDPTYGGWVIGGGLVRTGNGSASAKPHFRLTETGSFHSYDAVSGSGTETTKQRIVVSYDSTGGTIAINGGAAVSMSDAPKRLAAMYLGSYDGTQAFIGANARILRLSATSSARLSDDNVVALSAASS